jgi:hypothetical protein
MIYTRSQSQAPLLRCVNKEEGQQILSEVHAGVCRGHIGARALAAKVLWWSFHWPAMIDDIAKLVSICEACKRFSHKMKAPTQPVQLIASLWPLQRWGTDIVGKLTLTQGYYTFAVITVEYFTKWIEAKPLTNVSSTTIKKFFWQNVICRYGVPRHIIVDNAKKFDNAMFKEFYQQIITKVAFTSIYHPQSNGGVKKSQLFDLPSNEEDIGWREERKMGGGHANDNMEP